MSDHLTVVGRTTAVMALTTGLAAAMSMPAQARGAGTAAESVASGINPASAWPAEPAFATSPARYTSALSAPVTATVTFDSASLSVATAATRPAPVAATAPRTALADRTVATRASRSTRSEAPAASAKPKAKKASASSAKGGSIMATAARYAGTPYRYGGTTPSGFDCSGFTSYVFRQAGISLPRTADAQMKATTRISRSTARAGDLVFFVSGGRAYHTGIYAGDGMLWDSPRAGKSVSKRAIWDATVVFTRV